MADFVRFIIVDSYVVLGKMSFPTFAKIGVIIRKCNFFGACFLGEEA